MGADGSYIVGGRDAAPHSRPYMFSLQIQGCHNCGGALQREDSVVTAAHYSGGPLVCDGAAAGTVARFRCGNPKCPDVYTRLSSYRAWIKKVLKNN
ncbi:neutrophil elastase 2A-like [Pholidichthys leucotaenia]